MNDKGYDKKSLNYMSSLKNYSQAPKLCFIEAIKQIKTPKYEII